jgi:hypothetical protein
MPRTSSRIALTPFALLVLCATALADSSRPQGPAAACEATASFSVSQKDAGPPATVTQITIFRFPAAGALLFVTGMAVDADGAPKAYHPTGTPGLDFLGNAGHPARGTQPANWWGVVTENGKRSGSPIVQGPADPAPGFYVSKTTLADESKPDRDPTKYVDSTQVPYVVLPPALLGRGKARMGDVAIVLNPSNGAWSPAIVADRGPRGSLGEGSLALAVALHIPTNLRARHAGQADGVIYLVFLHTSATPAWPRTGEDINASVRRAFDAIGGRSKIEQCFPLSRFKWEQVP